MVQHAATDLSEAANNSRWVKLEWTNAISLEKAIIPCQMDTARLPAILAHKAYQLIIFYRASAFWKNFQKMFVVAPSGTPVY